MTEPLCRYISIASISVKSWDPLIDWFQQRYECKLNVTSELLIEGTSTETKTMITKHLMSYNAESLNGLNFMVENLKSLILTMALVCQRLSVEEAVALSRLEVIIR